LIFIFTTIQKNVQFNLMQYVQNSKEFWFGLHQWMVNHICLNPVFVHQIFFQNIEPIDGFETESLDNKLEDYLLRKKFNSFT